MGLLSISLIAQEQKEVVTGSGYADDVYYSLENGSVTTVARNNWDIAFTTQIQKFDVSILINSGEGVELYTYLKNDITGWATLDTAGIEWVPMYNSLDSLNVGAFSFGKDLDNEFDYGWGTYDQVSHAITGVSLYVIKTREGNFKKIWIVERAAMTNTWEFKFANLDGTGEESVTIDGSQYITKNFVYYSLESKELVDREPVSDDWDLLFTRYYDQSRSGTVSGVQSNADHVEVQEVREPGLDRSTFVTYEDALFSSTINIIGSDWKKLNQTYTGYDMVDTLVFFIKSDTDGASNYYKIYFTGATFGSEDGKYTFIQELLTTVSTELTRELTLLEVYPNPASGHVNLVFDRIGETSIQIIDITGRRVYSTVYHAGGFSNLSLDISYLNSGFYFIKVGTGNGAEVVRFIKE